MSKPDKGHADKVQIERDDLASILYAFLGAAMTMGLSDEQLPSRLIARIKNILEN